MQHFKFTLMLLAAFHLTPTLAQDRYVTDSFEITLRSGPSTSNSIRQMLKSGQKLQLLEADAGTGYSKVKLDNGREGYVLNRYLDTQPSGRQRAAELEQQVGELKTTLDQMQQQQQNNEQQQQTSAARITQLSTQLDQTLNAYEQLQEQTRDTVGILDQNRSQRERIQFLEQEQQRLTAENTTLKDRSAMDWFMRGAGVSLVAFLLGIIVTRIRWKKRDSWGDF
jgi:SH3 domain protein